MRRTAVVLAVLAVVAQAAPAGAVSGDSMNSPNRIDAVPYRHAANNGGATRDGRFERYPSGQCAYSEITGTIWYRYTHIGGTMPAVAEARGFDGLTAFVAVYEGPDAATANEVGCDTAQIAGAPDGAGSRGRVSFFLQPGGTYYLQVGGHDFRTGPYVVTLDYGFYIHIAGTGGGTNLRGGEACLSGACVG